MIDKSPSRTRCAADRDPSEIQGILEDIIQGMIDWFRPNRPYINDYLTLKKKINYSWSMNKLPNYFNNEINQHLAIDAQNIANEMEMLKNNWIAVSHANGVNDITIDIDDDGICPLVHVRGVRYINQDIVADIDRICKKYHRGYDIYPWKKEIEIYI